MILFEFEEDTLVVAQIVISSNDVINPEIIIPVNFTMLGPVTGIDLNENPEDRYGIQRIYPNPASDHITVIYKSPDGEAALAHILSSTGQRLMVNTLVPGQPLKINISNLRPGVYILVTLMGDQVSRKKFIVTK